MKRLACILIAIMFPLVCSGDGWFSTGAGGGEASCDGCVASTNRLVDPALTTSNSDGDYWLASQFTIAATRCVTGVWGKVGDDGNHNGTLYGEIWSNNATPDPDVPVAVVDGCTANKSYGVDIPNSPTDTEFLFASTITLPPGTYWVVFRNGAGSSATWAYSYQSDAGGVNAWSSNDGESWSASSWTKDFGVLGCVPE